MAAHGVIFHHFHGRMDGTDYPAGQRSISAEQLDGIIRSMGRGRIIPAQEFLDRAVCGRLRDHHVCLTFDDNLMCQYDLAIPVLEEFGLTAFWFVYTSVMQGNIERLEIYRHFRTTQFDTVDDFYAAFFVRLHESPFGGIAEKCLLRFEPRMYLSAFPSYSDGDRRFRYVRDDVLGPSAYAQVMDDMMRSAAYDVRAVARSLWMGNAEVRSLHEAGHVVGLHSHTHPTRLERLSEDEQRYEYKSNHAHLTALLGEPPMAVSHPCNSYNHTTLRILRSLGVKLGFRANTAIGFNSELELPREEHTGLVRRAVA